MDGSAGGLAATEARRRTSRRTLSFLLPYPHHPFSRLLLAVTYLSFFTKHCNGLFHSLLLVEEQEDEAGESVRSSTLPLFAFLHVVLDSVVLFDVA